MLKNFFLGLIALFLVFSHYRITEGFRVQKVLPRFFAWVASQSFLDEKEHQINTILDQPYTYLAKGQQCYVFESQDGKYVIKFLRDHKYRYPFWSYLSFLPQKLKEKAKKSLHMKDYRKKQTQMSIKIAMEDLKDETHLIFSHMQKTDDLHKTFCIIDSLHRKYYLELDKMQFIIQRKMEPLLSYLDQHPDQFSYVIDSFFDVVSKRVDKKIRNKNRRTMKNLGMCEGCVVELDIGEFRRKPDLENPENFNEELNKSCQDFRDFLQIKAPHYLNYFDGKLKTYRREI